MLRSERDPHGDDLESLRVVLEGFRYSFFCCIPCIVESFNPSDNTITAQPVIQNININDGLNVNESFPLLNHVPVLFPGGKDLFITFPINVGDECLVVFADRAIDSWWQQGGEQPPIMSRAHDLSDGFAIFAPRSLPNVIQSYDNNSIQIRNKELTSQITINENGKIFVKSDKDIHLTNQDESAFITLQTEGTKKIKLSCPPPGEGVEIDGNLLVTGSVSIGGGLAFIGSSANITASGAVTQVNFGTLGIVSNSVQLHTHTHGGVQTGSGSTGGPVG